MARRTGAGCVGFGRPNRWAGLVPLIDGHVFRCPIDDGKARCCPVAARADEVPRGAEPAPTSHPAGRARNRDQGMSFGVSGLARDLAVRLIVVCR